MESKDKKAGSNDDEVVSGGNQIDEVKETSICSSQPTQNSQPDGPDVIKDCSNFAGEEHNDCQLSETKLSDSQVSVNLNNVEAVEACVFQSVSNLKNEDTIVEQVDETLSNQGTEAGSSCLETNEGSAKVFTVSLPVSTRGENVTGEMDSSDQLSQTPVECVPLSETDFIKNNDTEFSKSDLTSEMQVGDLQVLEACEKKSVQPSEETFYTIVDNESNFLEEIVTENLSELSVSGKQVRAEPMNHVDPVDTLVGEPDTALLESTPSIGEIVAEKTQNLNLDVVEDNSSSRRIKLLKNQVSRSLNLCSKSMDDDFLLFKKFCEEEMDQQPILRQEMSSQAELLQSILDSAEELPEELKVKVLDHWEACFNGGHWLEKSVKTKQLTECRQSMNKSYVSLRYSGISKIKSTIDPYFQVTSKSTLQETRTDTEESSCDPFLVTVTHIIDPGEFYIVRMCDEGKLERILSELRDNASSYPIPLEITPGMVYAVCNSGFNWFRGSCGKECGRQQVGDQPAEILYEFFMIDQGHHERIPSSSIRILSQELLNYPNFARECTLNHNFQGAPWSIQATTLFKQMTRKSPMNMKIFSQHGGVLEVDLAQLPRFDEPAHIVSIRDALFFSHRPSSTEPPKKKFKPKFVIEELDCLKNFSVIVSAAETPSNIYLQVLDEQYPAYRQMKQELQDELNNASTPSSFSHIQKGFICAVKYHEVWYRCLVEEIYQHNKLLVFYVDSGHRRSVHCSECFNLPDRFLDLPAQVLRCTLDGVTHMNPRVPTVKRYRNYNHNPWSREAIEMVRSYRDARGVAIVENWKNGEIGRLDRELTAVVILYKDGEPASLNVILCRHNYVIGSTKKLVHPEHATIRSNLVARRKISQSTSINSVGSGLDAQSTDASVISMTPLENCSFSQPCSDPISINSVLTETAQVSKGLNKDQCDLVYEESVSVKPACVSSCFEKSCDDQVFGNPLAARNLNDLLTSVNSTHDAQEFIACEPSSSIQRPISSFEGNTFLVNEAANNATGGHLNLEAPDYIPNPWTNYEFKFGNVLTSESMKNDFSLKTLMNNTPPEDFSRACNPGNEHIAQDTLTDLTSRMTLQSSALQSNFSTASSNELPKEVVNKIGGSSDGASFVKFNPDFDIVGTQGTQPDSETSITVSLVWIDSPEAIFFRTADMQSQFEDLRYQMKKHYGKISRRPGRNFDIGVRCAVREGHSWWRAEVVCMDSYPTCNVSFVDTGYQRAVDRKHIYPLEPEFDEIKRLMIKCSLFGVYPGTGDGKWSDEVVNYIRDRLMGSKGIYILKRGPESKYSALPVMCLYVYDVEAGPLQIPGMTRINLNEELIAMGLAHHCSEPLLLPKHIPVIRTWKSSEPPKCGSVFWGIVTWVKLSGEIYLHDVKSAPALSEIRKWLNDAYNGTEPSHADLNCRPGELCIARYKLDQTWCRAIVIKPDEPGSVNVLFVDYGTYDSVDCRDIRLNIMLEELPTLAICCKFFNIRPSGGDPDWPVETLDLIHRDIVDQEFRVLVKVRSLPLQVVLMDKRNNSYSNYLVRENYAEFIDPSLKKKSKKKKNGKKP